MASQLLLPIPTGLPAEFLQIAENFRSVLFIILASSFRTSRREDMMAPDHLTVVQVFLLSQGTISLLPSSSNHEWTNGLLFFLFKASLNYSALVSFLCILLGIVAVLALKAVMTTRPHEIVLPLDCVIMQNTGGLGKFLVYKEAFLLLLKSFFNTSQGQAMLTATRLTMVHVLVLSLLGMLFFLSILTPELPFISSSNHYWINKLLVVLLEALVASAVVSVLCIPLPDYLRRKAYTCFTLGLAAALAYDGFTSNRGTSMFVLHCLTIL